jgi:hypothetical protein
MTSRILDLRARMLTTTPLRAVVVLAIVAAAVSSATVAFGAIGDSGTLTACVNTSKGSWRVLAQGSCRSSELPVEIYTKSGADAAFLTQTAADAAFLGKTATAADSDRLDGLDSSDFMPLTNCIGYPHGDIDWHGCDLHFANLNDARLFGANLSGASLFVAGLVGADLRTANLSGADLRRANLFGAFLVSADLTGADLTGATLIDADLTDANLTGVIWSNTWCPDGTNSDDDDATCVGHL